MSKVKLLILLSICVVGFRANLGAVERPLIEIDISIQNIVSSKDSDSKSLGYGSATNIGGLSTSSTQAGLLDGSFPRKDIQNIIEQEKDRTLRGRTTAIHYKITNFQADGTHLKDPEAFQHLFEFVWSLNRFDYGFVSSDKKWVTGSALPPVFFFDQPSKATVHGIGEAEVSLGDVDFPIAPNMKIWDIEQVFSGADFKVIQTGYAVNRPVLISFRGPKFAALNLNDMRLVLEGRAALDDVMIKTVRSPFWYPFDRYSMTFKFGTVYPADVNLRFKNIEDLQVFPEHEFRFLAEGKRAYDFLVNFKREDVNRTHGWPLIFGVLVPALLFLFEKAKAVVRMLTYVCWLAGTYVTLPTPDGVPIICIGNILLFVLFLVVLVLVERNHWPERRVIRGR